MPIFQDLPFLQLSLGIIGSLFLLSVGRIFALGRENRQMTKDQAKLENWAVAQQAELESLHHDSQSWRARNQRQFDAIRADLGSRLEQAERGNAHAQKQREAAQDKALRAAMAKIDELEAALAADAPASPLPELPAMDILRMESQLAELDTVKADAAAQRQRNGELQRALLLARRRHPPTRRSSSRVSRHG